jgi:AraC-like DNA-binding protein
MYIKTTRYATFDSIELKESFFKAYTLPDHFHEVYCIGLLSQGIKKSVVEGNNVLIPSNTITIVNPYQVHSDKNFDEDASLFRMIYLNSDVVNYLAKRITGANVRQVSFCNEAIQDPQLVNLFLTFFGENNTDQLNEQNIQQLIELLLENHKAPAQEDTFTSSAAIDDSVQLAQTIFTEKIDISKLAQLCKLSKFQFIRQFKKRTGLTPAAYMLVCRINYAKSLLVKGVPIGQAGLEAGFYDHPQFSRYFRHFTNLSPMEYIGNCNIVQA